MKKKKSKSFKVTRRMQKGPTNTSPKAVSKATSGRSPAGRMQSHGNINTSIAFTKKPAQKTSGARTPNKKVTNNPTRSLATIKKSLRKSMGY